MLYRFVLLMLVPVRIALSDKSWVLLGQEETFGLSPEPREL